MTNVIRMVFGRRKKGIRPMRDIGTLTGALERVALHVVRSDESSRSYFGGDPRLPFNVPWPHRDSERLNFLARLSLEELQATEATPWLPPTGALLFFYNVEKQPWGFDPADRGGWSVLHVPDAPPTSPQSAQEMPGNLPFISVKFRRIHVLPSGERTEVSALKFSQDEFERYFELSDQRFQGLPKHQMLGLPSPVQNDSMELESQLASNGVYCGNPEGFASARAKQIEDGARNWRLLYQMDSDDALGVMWGDVGMLYFWVEESAATRGDFSNVWLVLQCG
jgi:uncharacterized protein YwqG